MTGMPEASIARELAMCFTSVALVTDLDAGVEEGQGVTHHEVLEVFGRNVERLKGLIAGVVQQLPDDDACALPARARRPAAAVRAAVTGGPAPPA